METSLGFEYAFWLTISSVVTLTLLLTSLYGLSRIWVKFSKGIQETRMFKSYTKAMQDMEKFYETLRGCMWQGFVINPLNFALSVTGKVLTQIKSLNLGELILPLLIAGTVVSIPFIVFLSPNVNMARDSILGIASAGATIGILLAPFTTWKKRQLGIVRTTGIFAGTVLGSSWFACFVVAMLIVMASD